MHRADRARHRKEENLILRTAKIWPLTSFAASDARKTARGAILSADIALKRSTRSRSASVSAGIVAVIRLQAKGAMQFEVTPERAISSAIELEGPTTPIRSAEHPSELQQQLRISNAVRCIKQ